jgi:CRP-like cAMP-binding protein
MSAAEIKRIPKGSAVFDQGGAANDFFVLLQGYIKAVQATPSGEQTVVHFVGSREFFGCASLMGISHYPETALAIEDSIVLSWRAADMFRLMTSHPVIAVNLLRGVGSRMIEMQGRVGEIHTERVSRRIARALLHLARQSGRQMEIGIKIDFPLSRQDLAEMTGTTLYTVSRTLSRWQRLGILKGGRKSVIIVNPHRLVAVARGHE